MSRSRRRRRMGVWLVTVMVAVGLRAGESGTVGGGLAPSRPGAFEVSPDPEGNYVYEATAARPLVENLTAFRVETNRPVEGLITAVADRKSVV